MRRRSGGFVTRPLAKWSHTLPKADSDQNAIALKPAPTVVVTKP